MPRRWMSVFSAAVILCLAANWAQATGSESTSTSDDLIVQVDARWAGGACGGYFPIRVKLVNRGPTRQLTFRFASQNSGIAMPRVERAVTADQNATVRFTLSVPMVADMNFGTLDLLDNGRPLDAHRRQLQLPEANRIYGSVNPVVPSLLVISATPVDYSRFDAAVESRGAASTGRYAYARGSAAYEVVGPTMLPESWIDYSGLDLVAVSWETFASLPAPARDAIVQWVHCGGTLIVFGVGPAAGKRDELSRLLGFGEHRFAEAAWQPTIMQRQRVAVPQTDEFGNPLPPGMRRPRGGPPPNQDENSSTPVDEGFAWPGTPEDFVSRDLMLGKVYAFQGNSFPGSVHDWAWFLGTVGDNRLQWDRRHGMSARDETPQFLEFLVPGVRGVPTYTFLVLITLFAIVIGPVNYLLLWKRRQLYMLFVTVPVIAFLTSASLLSYSLIAHGFEVKSRLRSLTFLDQPARISVTMARLALYAGLAPSDGLRFSPDTAVYPVWPKGLGFESGTVDWTDTQHLESGWLRSRTHTQFLTMSHSAARGRLEVETPKSSQMTVANGHEFDIDMLLVADASGQVYSGVDIPAGAAATLQPATKVEFDRLTVLLDRDAPLLPEGIDDPDELHMFSVLSQPRRFRPRGITQQNTRFSSNLMEQQIAQWRQMSASSRTLPPRSYLAVIHDNPGVETGLRETEAEAGYHLLVGYY